MRSISARLEWLEHRPHGLIPRFTAIFDDGNQAAVDTAALYALLHTDIVVEPKKEG